jgi:hypothetical protein
MLVGKGYGTGKWDGLKIGTWRIHLLAGLLRPMLDSMRK